MKIEELNPQLQEEYQVVEAPCGPITLEGMAGYFNDCHMRLPEYLWDQVNSDVTILSTHTAGGAVRFRTDSPQIRIAVESTGWAMMDHMPLTGSAGCDVYVDNAYKATVRPGGELPTAHYESVVNLKGTLCDVRINLPLYNGVRKITIGFKPESTVEAPSPYARALPIVYYGSSITQGGCASRPGNSYQGYLTRLLNMGQINLGFSGSGRGEQNMAEYIASLPQSVFVMDYDYNAPDVEHLRNTHEAFFKTVRAKQPDLPVVMVSKPDADTNPEVSARRREVIRQTYLNALNAGDKNVYFLDGGKFFDGPFRDSCTVDGCHPNDLGFLRMAQGMYPTLKEILGL